MELTVLLPIISEILKGEGTVGSKLVIGGFLLVIIHLMGRNHIKLITSEMKSMKAEMVKGFEGINSQLQAGKEIHARHEQEITTLKRDVQKLQGLSSQRTS